MSAEQDSSFRPIAFAWLEQSGERRYVESETRIGRSPLNDIRLNDASISRDHAIIRRIDGDYIVSDLNSANGTFVNNQRVYAPQALSAGDRLRFAAVEFKFDVELTEDAAAQAAPARPKTSISQFLTMSSQGHLQEYVDGDLRVVTVLFLDLCGFTALSEKLSPERVVLIVNQCFQHLTETAVRFGGYVDKYIGDAMMVLFGAPQAHDDDPERAVRAAVAMRESLARFSARLQRRSGIELQTRVGINTGEVLAGHVGSAEFSAFTVMGDTVNLASRLEQAARVGHILVSESTYQLTRRVVRYTALPAIQIRGKNEPVATYEVESLEPETAALSADVAGGFVGRSAELRALADVVAGGPRFRSVAILGEAGIGKTRAIEQFRRLHASDDAWATIDCAACIQPPGYSPVRALGRALAEMLEARQSAPVAHAIEPFVGQSWAEPTEEDQSAADHDSEAVRQQLAKALAELIAELAQHTRVIIVLDRAELAGPDAYAVLERAAALLDNADVVLLMTARSLPTQAWQSSPVTFWLQPLSHNESRQLIGYLLGRDPIDPASLESLARWGDGSPLCIEEIVASALKAGSLQSDGGTWRLAPELDIRPAYRLRSLVQASLDRIDAAELDVLRIASLLGRPFSPGLLREALDAPVSDSALERLLELGYLQKVDGSETALAFGAEFVRAVIHVSLPELKRRRFHERIAVALAGQCDSSVADPIDLHEIAQHFAGAGQRARADEYLLRAADVTTSKMTRREAVGYYREMLRDAAAVSDRGEHARLYADVQERIGDALLRDATLAEAQIAFELAVASSGVRQRRAGLQLKLTVVALHQGTPRRALESAESILALPEASPGTRAGAEAIAAMAMAALGEMSPAMQRAHDAVGMASESKEPGTAGLAHYAIARVQFLAGDLAAARVSARLSLAARQQAGEHAAVCETLGLLGLVECALGDLADAESSTRAALEPESGGPNGGTPQDPDRWTVSNAALVFGRLLAHRGDLARAEHRLTSAFRAAEQAGAREVALESRLELTQLQLLGVPGRAGVEPDHAILQKYDGIIAELDSSLEASLALELHPLACRIRTVLATALSARANDGDRRLALDLAREAHLAARTSGLKLHEAVARRSLGVSLAGLGYWSRAAGEFEASAQQLEQLGARVELVRTLIAAAQAEHTTYPAANVTTLRTKLERAIGLAESVGLEGDRRAAVQLVQELRVAPSSPP